MTLTVLATPTYQAVALVVRAMLAEAGLDVQIDARPAGTYWSSGKDTGLELSVQRFGGQPDPAFQTQWFVSSQIGAWNWQRWSNPDFDRLDTAARSTDDTAARGARLRADAETHGRVRGLHLADQRGERLRHRVVAGTRRSSPTGDDLQFPMFRLA